MGKDKKNFEPKIRADDGVEYEGADKPETFSNFEELMKRVEQLQEVVDEHAGILQHNDLVRTEKIEAPYFDEDEVYKKLEEENDTQ